jgi:glycosyltransferase involved in cell wall biosynthesis
VPAYNAENTIEFSLKSLLSQSYSGLEIIVLDDASTDGTEKIVRRMAAEDSRIRCIRFEENRGCYVMMNAGIRASKGNIIALQGADDISMPERIARQISPILAGRVQITIAKLIRSHCSIEEFSIENAEELRKRAERKQLIDENGIYQAANQAEICLASTVALKSVFEKYGLFWEGRYSCDTEFWERIIFREHNIRVPENAENVKQYINETRYAESLFEVVDDVLYLSPERNEFNLTVKYPLGGEQRINFRKTYRNRLIGIGDYQYPTL